MLDVVTPWNLPDAPLLLNTTHPASPYLQTQSATRLADWLYCCETISIHFRIAECSCQLRHLYRTSHVPASHSRCGGTACSATVEDT